jgi:cell division protein FtsB
MDGPKITIVAIVLLLVGLLGGYLFWGAPGAKLADELAAAQAKLGEAAEAQKREAAMKARLDAAEAQIKKLADQLAEARKARQDLDLKISTLRK